MSPSEKRKLKLKQMSESMFGNNHNYGKIIKRLVPGESKRSKSKHVDYELAEKNHEET